MPRLSSCAGSRHSHRTSGPHWGGARFRLAWTGNAWHLAEFAIAVGAGVATGSVALVGFRIDSVIEALAGLVVVWLFSGGRGASHAAERSAQ